MESRRDRAEAWLGQTGLISFVKTHVASKYYTCHAGLCGKGFEGQSKKTGQFLLRKMSKKREGPAGSDGHSALYMIHWPCCLWDTQCPSHLPPEEIKTQLSQGFAQDHTGNMCLY